MKAPLSFTQWLWRKIVAFFNIFKKMTKAEWKELRIILEFYFGLICSMIFGGFSFLHWWLVFPFLFFFLLFLHSLYLMDTED